MKKRRVLIVDDEPSVRFALRDFLESNGYEVAEAVDCASAEEAFRKTRPHTAVIDYRMPDGTALDILPRLRGRYPLVPIVILTAHGTIDLAVEAIKQGAEHLLTKPTQLPDLLKIVERLTEPNEDTPVLDPFIGSSPAIRELQERARVALNAERPVLIQGETGSGKSVLAAWLAANGTRADGPYIQMQVAGVAGSQDAELFGQTGADFEKRGAFELADGGTLCLHAIDELSDDVQPKLLRFLEEQQYRGVDEIYDRTSDVRVIATTAVDLLESGRLREDLYFRISNLILNVPPLQQRPDDIEPLAHALLAELAKELDIELTLPADCLAALESNPWRGHILELSNVLERAVFSTGLTTPLTLQHIENAISDRDMSKSDDSIIIADTFRSATRRFQARLLERTLRATDWKIAKAAGQLGLTRAHVYNLIRDFGLKRR